MVSGHQTVVKCAGGYYVGSEEVWGFLKFFSEMIL